MQRKYKGWKEIQDTVPEELLGGKAKGEVGAKVVEDSDEEQKKTAEYDEDSEGEIDTTMPDYDYLLKMAIWSLTKERIDKMKEQMLKLKE